MQVEETDVMMVGITYHPQTFKLFDIQMPYTGDWSFWNYTQTATKFLKLKRIEEHGVYNVEMSLL